jgi:uncharacterized membrane protein YhaH (DUF805 family)
MNHPLRLDDFWNPRGRTTRRGYALAGFGLMTAKFALDRVVVLSLGGNYWNWLSYWNPLARFRYGGTMPSYVVPLLILALPFMATGIVLTLRRLRDAGWPLWLTILFFVPALNLFLFAALCLVPSREREPGPPVVVPGVLGRLAKILMLQNPALSAVVAIFLTVVMIVPLTWLATFFFRNYGWGVFVAEPFVLGLVAAVVHSAPEPRTWGSCVGVALLALLFSALAILAVAIEGIMCLLMAAPIAAPIVMLGATVGYFLQLVRWGRLAETARLYSAAWIALPFVFAGEKFAQPSPATMAVTTAVEIAAPPPVVWRQVVTFSELRPPHELVFRSGIAYPVRATITGRGVGAVRRCEFSTGPFVEPITVWDEPRWLAFDVVAQPHPMRELSPYRSLHTPHLENFFRSRHGEFRLVALPDGRTRLVGTTWYTQELWPARYWQFWSDYLVHTIHARVLEHIRAEAEHVAAASKPAAG